jgi:hypothetical protein
LPLPEEGKPKDFSGTLGEFDLEVTVTPQEVKVGDPATLKATVRGRGNFSTVNLPAIDLGSNFKSYEPQAKQEGNAKTFEQVLIPLNAAVKEVPALAFSFFNTSTGQYTTITRGPFPLNVIKPDKEEEFRVVEKKQPFQGAVKEEKLGRDITYLKDSPGRWSKKGKYVYGDAKMFWLWGIVLFIAYAICAFFEINNKRLRTDVRYARQLLAPRKAKAGLVKARKYLDQGTAQEFYDIVFETLQEYLGNRFHLPSKGITASIVEDQFKNKNISEDILAKLKDIFKDCDAARYAASQLTRDDRENSLDKLEKIIDYFQRNKV